MDSQNDFIRFRDTFLSNVRLRSRTAKGNAHTNVSELKLPLLLSGEGLQEQIQTNLQKTAEVIYASSRTTKRIDVSWCKKTFDFWFDLLQCGLLDMKGYGEKEEKLGINLPNCRFRIWDVSYNPMSPKPSEIASRMMMFEQQLAQRISSIDTLSDKTALAELLAFADRELDSVIHPWLDGCGRFATTVVMWLAARTPGMLLPKFGPREEHYRAIKTLESHTEYFLRCLSR